VEVGYTLVGGGAFLRVVCKRTGGVIQ
jgi:hypothetical protein